jgi:hypothetical protein
VGQVLGSSAGFDVTIKQNIGLPLPAFLGFHSSISYYETLTKVFLGYDVVFSSWTARIAEDLSNVATIEALKF